MSRILFVMLHPGFVRYYEDALDALAAEGHDIHVAFEVHRTKLGEDETARRLAHRSPRITCGPAPERQESVRQFLVRADRTALRAGTEPRPRTAAGDWESLGTTVRLLSDYTRFFGPAFAGAVALRARVEKRLPPVYQAWTRRLAGTAAGRACLSAVCRAVEAVVPVAPGIDAFLAEHRPDLLLVTPLIELGSQQVDYIKAARARGIRSGLAVASWDNLTSKGLIRVVPDHVIVWNEAQRDEAVALHGVRPEQVSVTGAHLFDRWFTMQPTRSREAFCRDAGLDPDRPFVLYVGSSVFIAPDEVPFAERWLAALRASADPALAGVGALIRPHPANARQWHALDRAAFPATAVWPPIGTDPTSPGFRDDYFDSLYYCAAVVGINTSAQVEASIIGRPVLTVRAPEFAHSQDGTLHFKHLVEGAVTSAASLAEHLAQLGRILGGDDAWRGRTRTFVERFLRPRGIERPAAPVFAEVVGALAAQLRLRPRPVPAAVRVARVCLRPVAWLAGVVAEGRPLWVYPLRPLLAAGIAVAVVPERAALAWKDGGPALAVKRARRQVWTLWYESTNHARRWGRRATKGIRRVAGGARNVARRVTAPRSR